MNKFLMIVIGSIAAIVALANLGSLLGLAVSALLIYGGIHYYAKSVSTLAKVWWAIVGITGAITAISNVPAFFAVIAIVVLWMIYRKWNEAEARPAAVRTDDPFTNFENQWKELTK